LYFSGKKRKGSWFLGALEQMRWLNAARACFFDYYFSENDDVILAVFP
jgi:hypothetical protein